MKILVQESSQSYHASSEPSESRCEAPPSKEDGGLGTRMILYPWETLRKRERVYGGKTINNKLGTTNDLHTSFIVNNIHLTSSALARVILTKEVYM